MRNIKRYYATVGLLEHYYEVYLQTLYKRLPKFFPRVSSHDIGKLKYNPKYNFDGVPENLIGEITRANWAACQETLLEAKAIGISSYTSNIELHAV